MDANVSFAASSFSLRCTDPAVMRVRSLQKLPRPVVVDCGVADVTEEGAQAMRAMCAGRGVTGQDRGSLLRTEERLGPWLRPERSPRLAPGHGFPRFTSPLTRSVSAIS